MCPVARLSEATRPCSTQIHIAMGRLPTTSTRSTLASVESGVLVLWVFFFSSRRRHTRCGRDWSSDVCSSDLFVRGAAHHERREDRREALLQHVVEREGRQGLVQAHEVSEQVDETGTGDLPGAFEVREPQRLEQVAVRLAFEIEFPRRAPSSDLDVLRVVLADRDALME